MDFNVTVEGGAVGDFNSDMQFLDSFDSELLKVLLEQWALGDADLCMCNNQDYYFVLGLNTEQDQVDDSAKATFQEKASLLTNIRISHSKVIGVNENGSPKLQIQKMRPCLANNVIFWFNTH